LVESRIEHINLAQKFIKEISEATFDNGDLDENVSENLKRVLPMYLLPMSALPSTFL